MTTTVKLSKLTLSPINVRRRPDDLLEIPQMAADLEARGVLQNLLVTPVKKPRGTFEVFDGGRRLRGLLMLAERGTIDPETYDVPVKVLVGDEATLSAVVQMSPQRVVYVSCNPATAARDAAWLQQHGYYAQTVQPVDLFPRTKHCECVLAFHRTDAKN